MKVLLATRNTGKAREIEEILGPFFELVTLESFSALAEPEEDGATFAANARLKATYYRAQTGLASLADDSGLEVAALRGAPGVRSSRYAATDPERIARLLRELGDTPQTGRSARFVCAMCLDLGGRFIEEEGAVEGMISDAPRGNGGFGYDPVFYYPPLDKTFGEIPASIKNRISHRADALQKLTRRLVEELPEP